MTLQAVKLRKQLKLQRSVRGIVIVDRQLLLVAEQGGKFKPPGGRREHGESSEAGLMRELLEEVACRPAFYERYGQIRDERKLTDYFLVELIGTPVPSSEIVDLVWSSRPETLGNISCKTLELVEQLYDDDLL